MKVIGTETCLKGIKGREGRVRSFWIRCGGRGTFVDTAITLTYQDDGRVITKRGVNRKRRDVKSNIHRLRRKG